MTSHAKKCGCSTTDGNDARADRESRCRGGPWLARAARFVRTVRHLRARQVAYQVLHRGRPWRGPAAPAAGGPSQGSAPVPRGPAASALSALPAPADDQPDVLSGVLTFQNRSVTVGFPPDWNRTDLPRHWLYHLHYHDFLWALPFERAREAARHWMAHHPPGPGRTGWEPYPTSLRLANWCALFLGRHRARTLADPAFRDALWAGVRRQAGHLERNLEWRLLGNHLLENAAALAVAGSGFAHPDADRWLATGLRLLARELPEQLLADGGHVERSPMYQCRVLYVLLLLRAAGTPAVRDLVGPYVTPAARALAALTHPDGGIALLNDSAFGVYPMPGALVRAAGAAPAGAGPFALADTGYASAFGVQPVPAVPVRATGASPAGAGPFAVDETGYADQVQREALDQAGAGPFALADTGYYGARTAAGDYVVCDAAPLGPDYQPGHGHADLLSFELSLRGARVVVDGGVSTYEAGPMRDWCRSTRAHNTVEIDGCDSAETWAAFRVGRRGRPRGVAWTPADGGFELSARHDGYRHLPGRPVHARTFRWRSGSLEIADRVDARRPVRAVARLHFHPDCRLSDRTGEACTVSFPGGRARVSWSGWEIVADDESWYCPAFGVERRNPCLAFSGAAATVRGSIRIRSLIPPSGRAADAC